MGGVTMTPIGQVEDNPLLTYFMANSGRAIHKWLDYFDVYHRTFAKFRGRPIKFLEIGVQNGGSMHMWRNYFGPHAQIIGVDIDPRCAALRSEGFDIWIGDQGDPQFWLGFLAKRQGIDVVLDDGGHTMAQQIGTFEALFPALRDGGVYLCEDTHTSYFPSHGGCIRAPGTFIEYIKDLIDDMHGWWHQPLSSLRGDCMARQLYSLSVYDSMVVMEKRRKNPPLSLSGGAQTIVQPPPPRCMDHLDLRRALGVPDE